MSLFFLGWTFLVIVATGEMTQVLASRIDYISRISPLIF